MRGKASLNLAKQISESETFAVSLLGCKTLRYLFSVLDNSPTIFQIMFYYIKYLTVTRVELYQTEPGSARIFRSGTVRRRKNDSFV